MSTPHPPDAARRAALQQALGPGYVLGDALGGGGMSAVYRAHEVALDRPVVVKVLPPELAAAVSVDRFRREILVSAALQHPNIVPILGAGDVEGLPYFLMPYVAGESLRARLARGPLGVREAVGVLRDVARALAHAHRNGLVHRDIKPDNILLSGGAAMVSDFGVAKALTTGGSSRRPTSGAHVAASVATAAGIAIGTPAYMAPEQAAGDPATDHRADLYALGIVAWEMLTGGSPYSGLTPQQVIAAQVTRTPPSLATRRYDVPTALSTLIGQLLQKEPQQRPKNAEQVLERLEDPLVLSNGPAHHAAHPTLRLPLALRLLVRAPLVSTVAIASLALGIGANTAIFSMVDQVLLRPLPVAAPSELVVFDASGPQPGSQMCSAMGPCSAAFTYPMFEDLGREHPGLAGLAGHRDFGANIAAHGQTLSAEGMLVSGNYFALLGLAPAAGRLITPDDARAPGAGTVAVLAYDYWQSTFGGDPAAVGQSLLVNGQALEIIGVAPRGFRGTSLATRPAVFVPVTLMGVMTPGWSGFASRQDYWLYLIGRLAPGTSRAQAAVALNTTYHRILAEVESPALTGITPQMRTRFLAKALQLAPGALGQSTLAEDVGTPLALLFGVTALVLLIACANIANLLLARAAARAGEFAVRLAIGGTRTHLVLQLLGESLVLGALGGLAGLGLAVFCLHAMQALLPGALGQAFVPALDLRVLGFATVLAMLTALAVGLAPALHATRPNLIGVLREQGGQPAGGRAAARWRTALATGQVALAMALLASAGLFARSLANVRRVDFGMRPEGVVTFGLSPALSGYDGTRSQALFARVREELAGLPGVTGVTGVSFAMVPVVSNSSWGNDVGVEGYPADRDLDHNSRYNEVAPGFFATLGVPLLSGREFTGTDAPGAPRVAIVNQAFARKFRLGDHPVGKRLDRGNGRLDYEIVGLVQDAAYERVKDEVVAAFFIPALQDPSLGAVTFYARTAGDPAALVAAIPRVVQALEPNLPVENLRTLPGQVRENTYLDHFLAILATTFAALATLLAALGLYGVLAYTVTQRTREFGVRMALGARPAEVRALVLRQVGRLTLVGVLLGLLGALALGRVAQALLYGMTGPDPLVLLGAALALGGVALLAGFIPAARAARLDPMRALRGE